MARDEQVRAWWAEAESALSQLIDRIRETGVASSSVVEESWCTAADTVLKLRTIVTMLESVELAVRHAPVRERAALEDGAGSLLVHLEQGLAGYRGLVGAAGRV